MGKTITVGNYKGGVGKTKNCVMIAYSLSNKGYKTLVIDLDPQANATSVLLKTKQLYDNSVFSLNKTLMTAIKEESLIDMQVNITENLDLIPSYIDFSNYEIYLEYKFGTLLPDNDSYDILKRKKLLHLKSLIDPLKNLYDYILIDVPPTKSAITDSAVLSSEFVLLVLQTQQLSLDGAEMYIEDLKDLYESYDKSFDICGVLPVLVDNHSTVDKLILRLAIEKFGKDIVFENPIPQMSRLKRFDNTGITDFDHHDQKVISLYNKITDEFIEKTESR